MKNPSGVKFCGECGARLEFTCAACGAANPPGDKFCGQCRASLVQAPSFTKFASPETYPLNISPKKSSHPRARSKANSNKSRFCCRHERLDGVTG
ncbi:MAG: zinc ribbon domain-containing protein [Deltaproteobacteria bacterium]|nr:MAG: zinc ribbon domain-containing protein [Deltaproteobacteria bacterium]